MKKRGLIKDLVSVVIPTRNRLQLLKRAIQSVLNQSYQQLEIIVVNDGSTDGTKEYLDQLTNELENICVFHSYPAKGACSARNIGIWNAKGEYLTLLDDDDEYFPKRISALLKVFQKNPDLAFVCSSYLVIQDGKNIVLNAKLKELELSNVFWKNTMGNSLLTYTDRIRAINGFDERLTSAQDYDLFIRLIKVFGKALRIKEPLLILHTEHGGDRIATSPERYKGLLRFYKKHARDMTFAQRQYYHYKYRKNHHRKGDLSAFKNAFWQLPIKYKYLELGHLVKKFLTQGTSYFLKK
ncbi:MAG: glycosyltransferase [Bacteroidota bacterium]